MIPDSRVVAIWSPLLSHTFNIGIFSGRISAISSWRPAPRAIAREMAHQYRSDALPWYWSMTANAISAFAGCTTT